MVSTMVLFEPPRNFPNQLVISGFEVENEINDPVDMYDSQAP